MDRIIYSKSHTLFNDFLKNTQVQHYISRLKSHHPETCKHSLRVSLLAIDLGIQNNLQHQLKVLCYAGILHDIGKLHITPSILSKPSPLNKLEKKLIKSHVRLGFLELSSPEYKEVREIVVSHHEYKQNPYCRTGKDRRNNKRNTRDRRNNSKIRDQLAQIIAISDIFDALASKRAYKKPYSREKAEKIIKKHFLGGKKYIEQVLARYI